MKSLKVAPALLTLALATHVVVADTEFGDSVPREVVNQFIGDPFGGSGKLYSDIFAAFPPFTVPQDFSVLASADQGYIQRVVLKTSLEAEAAKAAVVEAFTSAGWQQLPVYGGAAPQTGFVSAAPPAQPTQLCNDDFGNVSISVTAGAAPRYLSLARNNLSGMGVMRGQQQTCAEQIEMYSQGPGFMRSRMGPQLSEYVPRLIMPESTAPASPMPSSFISGGGGGSSNDWETEGSLMSDLGIDAVLAHFTDQVDAQGWTDDSEVTGATVATASWTRTVDGLDLIGLLTIVELADDTWSMKFRVVRKNTTGPNVNRIVDEVAR